MAPPVTRRQARQARRRQQHRRIGLLGGVAIAVAAIVVISAIAFGVHKVETGSHGSTRSQTTLLMQIQGTDRTAAASVLLAHNTATKSGVVVLVPPRVISEVCGYGSQNFGDVLALPNGAALSRQTMSMMLNDVTVDGSWVVSEAQLAKLVDVYGGITVDVDTNVVRRTSGGGGQILIPAGTNEHLDGAKAVEYALYSTSPQTGGPAQLTRLNRVVDALLQALPTDPTPIAASLRQLGPSGSSTLGVDKLSTLLAGLASDSRSAAGVFPTDLPVTPIYAGGLSPSYRIDDSATGVPQLVHNQLAASLPADANRTRPSVLLLNGVGTPGLVLSACARLSASGYSYAGSGNAANFNNPTSSVVIKSDSDPNVALGDAVAKALRLPTGDVVHATENQDVADVVVILGNDYHP